MNTNAKIFVTGHRGMVVSALVRGLQSRGYTNVLTRSRAELDWLDLRAVKADWQSARRDHMVKAVGFQAYDHNE